MPVCLSIKNLESQSANDEWLVGWNNSTNKPVWGTAQFALCITTQQVDDYLLVINKKGKKGEGAVVPDRGF